MANIVSFHSFRGGTGKSNLVANVATVLALEGQRVGVIDADIQSPGIHVLFGLAGKDIRASLNDYLWHDRNIQDAAVDVTVNLGIDIPGEILLIPASTNPGEITRVLREGYEAEKLAAGFHRLHRELRLDTLLIDTHPGLNAETLLSIAISRTLAILMRPDQQDYEGTAVTVKVARELSVPNTFIVVNKTPPALDPDIVRVKVEQAYDCQVAAILPHSYEMLTLASEGIFILKYPNHPMTALYRHIAVKLSTANGRQG